MTKFKRTLIVAGLSCVFAIILAVVTDSFDYPLLFASLASSIILVFSKPADSMNRPTAVVGSHLIAAAIGIFSKWMFPENLILASGISIFLLMTSMILFGIFHPPAGGTAWSFILYSQTDDVLIGLLGGTLLLSLVTLGGKDSMVLNFLMYFFGTPFYQDSPIETIKEMEEILENEYKLIQDHPFIDKDVRMLQLERNEVVRRLMMFILSDQIKDKTEEQKMIRKIKSLDRKLEKKESPELKILDKRLDKLMVKLYNFIEEFGED